MSAAEAADAAEIREIPTPHGPARAHLHAPAPTVDGGPRGALVLGHGAGGSIAAPDLVAVRDAAVGAGLLVVLVEQPYRVAGRRTAAPVAQLDTAWLAVLERLRAEALADVPFVAGGRSSGARVAVRTAAITGAAGALCLAFPLVPPRRSPTARPKSRQPELDAAGVPVLVVQGERDPFGMPEPGPARDVVVVAGDHGLKRDTDTVAHAVLAWLDGVLPTRGLVP